MMKCFTVVAALSVAFVSSVTAQSQCNSVASAIPACGQSCLISAGSAIGCAVTDYACQCSSSSALQNSAQNCVINSCGISTALSVQASASAVCACVATATPASSAPASTSAAPASSAPASPVAPTSAPATSGPVGTSTPPVPASSSGESYVSSSAAPAAAGCSSGAPASSAPESALLSLTPGGPESTPPSTLLTVASAPAGSCVSVTVTKTVYFTAPATMPTTPATSCRGKIGTDYLICCVNKIFTSGD